MSADVALVEDHPLYLELTSLKEAVLHLQGETHRATIQLRHQSLEYTTLLQSLHALEDENAHLRTELEAHRRAAPVTTHRDTLQIQELTLALRRLSDKLDLTEKLLLEKNKELAEARSRRDASKKAEERAKEAVNRLQSELSASGARERELTHLVKTSEEQRKMSDLVVQEYASLVRSLEGRPSRGSQINRKSDESSLDGLTHARQGLHKLLQDSNYDSEKLHAEINRLSDALDSARADLVAEKAAAQGDRRRLAQAELDLHKLRCDDNAAAKMVSRYMKFSQSSSDMLHRTIDNLKTRLEAIIVSYESRLQQAMDRISFEKRQGDILRRALDDLTEDISRESYGRRREIVLRLAVLAREQILSERLRRWLLRSREVVHKVHAIEDYRDAAEKILSDATDLLSCIDSRLDLGSDSTEAMARICSAYAAVNTLQDELQRETDRRLYFEFQLATSTTQSGERPDSRATRSPMLSSIRKELPQPPLPVLSNASIDTDECTGGTDFQTLAGNLEKPDGPRLLVPSPHGATLAPSHSEDVKNPNTSCDLMGNGSKFEESPADSVPQKTDNALCLERTRVQECGDTPLKMTSKSATSSPASQEVSELEDLVTTEVPTVTPESRSGERASTDVLRTVAPVSSVDRLRPASTNDPLESTNCSRDDDSTKLSGSVERNDSRQPVDNLPVCEPSPSPASSFQPLSPNERYKEDMCGHEEANGSEIREASITEQLTDTGVTTLLSRLATVDGRYANLQRAFRDCHLALQGLRQDCRSAPNPDVLSVVVDRLSDYCEDARVELEIRIADEERIARGFQTLLSVPGALSDEVNEPEVMKQMESFIDGTDSAVRRAETVLNHKLDDLEHDVASVKRALHSSSPPLRPEDFHDQPNLPKIPGWPPWTGSVLVTSRNPAAAPSFGTVMTSPRLRHASSTRSLRSESNNAPGPFASLGLRIPVPSSLRHQPERPPSPIKVKGPARPSTVFGLGLRGGLAHGIRTFEFNAVGTSNPAKDDDDLNSDVE